MKGSAGILKRIKTKTKHSKGTNKDFYVNVRTVLLYLAAIALSLIHIFGEAVCGDVPSFEKTDEDEQAEAQAVDAMLSLLSEKKHREFSALFAEMNALETREAKIWRALDMLEAAAQHNEAALSTWLPLEREPVSYTHLFLRYHAV